MMPSQNYDNFGDRASSPTKNFSKQQKIGLSVLIFFTIMVVVLWYWQLQKNITYPLYGGMNPKDLAKESYTPTATSTTDLDTDKDGLTDYQEVNLYQTSPYMTDTDNDGLLDGQEVKNKTNPNCPEGKQCAGGLVVGQTVGDATLWQNGASSTVSQAIDQSGLDILNQLNQMSAPTTAEINQVGGAALSPSDATALKRAFGDNPDIKLFRQKLLQAATTEADKQTINNMTDDVLLQLYQTMIANATN